MLCVIMDGVGICCCWLVVCLVWLVWWVDWLVWGFVLVGSG